MHYTPLRYPGGKAKFAPAVKQIIEQNNLYGHYVEPFAGGAGIALDLLFNNNVADIHINDLDLAVYNFWLSVTKFNNEFIKLIEETPVTIEEWHKQKQNINRTDLSTLEHGFATFFLNRTNRSGILKAGVMGGLNQTGNYKLDCRFNKAELMKRIERIGQYSEHIHIYNQDALELLSNIDSLIPRNSLIYLDPPYYVKGQGLYRNFYKHDDHKAICQTLANVKTPWIVSYDNHPAIKEIYQDYRQADYTLNYSANKKTKGSEVMIYCPQIKNTI
ncbi:DNA adenine methylase [Frederiksenia canicola]|uniref:site-specific DNA-methyltransferase (adenine-specific) n=1 Tax=Frederiksenia canicola TaxID=123824 RepID=A0AAE7C2D4_9PAST|nr:DNA adenine methylase [Frederiksenia canicola]QIM65236.1 DNA methyltransferase [Frederiksenia canicola]RPE96336.1 DNA adenine methylase [Frederiksenia canicola]